MKIVNLLYVAFVFFLFFVTSCNKDDDFSKYPVNDSEDAAFAEVDGGQSVVKVNLVEAGTNGEIAEMKITNKESDITLPTLYHKFESVDRNDDMSDLSSTNGTYTIECEGETIYRMVVKDGEIYSTEIIDEKAVAQGEYACTLRGIVRCADDTINDMNWIEYGSCLLGAPTCLATTYASCMWENC